MASGHAAAVESRSRRIHERDVKQAAADAEFQQRQAEHARNGRLPEHQKSVLFDAAVM